MILGIYLSYLGLVLFSLSLNKHYKMVMNKEAHKSIKGIALFLGTLSLIASLTILIEQLGLSLGITYWVGLLSIAIFLIAFVYSYQSKFILHLTLILFLISLLFTML